MSFQLSPEVDKNKIFLVKLSELEGRLDPSSYSIRNIFLDSIFSLEKISDYFFINPQQKSNIKENDTYSFVPMENISKSDATIKNLGIIKGVNTKGYTPFNMGDLIFAKITPCMENGKMAVVKYLPHSMAFGSTEFHVFRPKNKLSVHYLRSLFLIDRFREYAKCNFTGTAGHQRVPPEFFYKLKIPIPPKEIQTQIVAKMDTAYATKKQKEAEAQRLLDGIDGYLLGELGIELPKQAENTLQSRIFTRQLSEVSGGRFDAEYYQEKYTAFDKALNNGKYSLEKISQCIKFCKKGVEVGSKNYQNTGVPFVRVADIDGWEIYPDNCDKYISNELFCQLSENFTPSIGEIIYTKDGTIGYSSIIENKKDFVISSGLLRIMPDDHINAYYLKAVLSSSLLQTLAKRESIGAIILHLNTNKLLSLEIPLPPLAKQTKIANHITKIRSRAKELQKQAKTGLEQAKKEVEAMILGEDASNKQ